MARGVNDLRVEAPVISDFSLLPLGAFWHSTRCAIGDRRSYSKCQRGLKTSALGKSKLEPLLVPRKEISIHTFIYIYIYIYMYLCTYAHLYVINKEKSTYMLEICICMVLYACLYLYM